MRNSLPFSSVFCFEREHAKDFAGAQRNSLRGSTLPSEFPLRLNYPRGLELQGNHHAKIPIISINPSFDYFIGAAGSIRATERRPRESYQHSEATLRARRRYDFSRTVERLLMVYRLRRDGGTRHAFAWIGHDRKVHLDES